MFWNVPNSLTLVRVALTPLAIYCYWQHWLLSCFICIAVIMWSDYFDGMLARKLDQCTDIGALLDPVADKFFEMSFITVLAYMGDLPWFYAALLNLRNLAQLMSIPVLLWWKQIKFNVEPAWPAKWGSAFGMIVIAVVVMNQLFTGFELTLLQSVLVWISGGFELYMLITYLPRFWQIFHGQHDTFV